jgi:hypothetical protein
MLAVTLTINGQAVADVTVRNQGPTCPDEARDPEGERRYLVRRYHPFVTTEVTHRRSDGAVVLAAKALAALADTP